MFYTERFVPFLSIVLQKKCFGIHLIGEDGAAEGKDQDGIVKEDKDGAAK